MSVNIDALFGISVVNSTGLLLLKITALKSFSFWYMGFNSFSATGNIEVFANNADSGEPARDELSHLKSALFAF